jgi:putative ABC transport system permease protein
MEDFFRDLKHSVRVFLQTPGFTLTAIAALTLGIGANTAVFSVVNTVLLRPVPFPDPDRIVLFMNSSPQGSGTNASPAKFNLWRQQTGAFQDVSAFRANVANITGGEEAEQIPIGQVSADFFRMLGAPMARGRPFSAEEDRPNGGRVVVLSYGLWQRRFAGDPDIVGKALPLDGQPHLILGVVGEDFRADGLVTFAASPPDAWLPFQLDPTSTMQGHYFIAAGKLKPGISLEAGKSQIQLAAQEFRRLYPNALPPEGSFDVQRLRDVQVTAVRSSLLIFVGAVSFVLLIACANVASLLLVRASARTREIAIRSAIGAGRGRIIRQLLTESVLLSIVGGLCGLVVGMIGIRALLALNPGNIPRIGPDGANVTLDWRVALFTFSVAVGTGLLFGLVPALQASRTNLNLALKESSGRSGTGFRQNKARAILVVSEIALALVLLVGAALLIRTFVALRTVNPGFDSANILTMRMSLSGPRFAPTAGVAQLIRDGVDRMRAVPGVEIAAATCCVPLAGGYGLPFVIAGRPLTEGPFHGGGGWYTISSDYFSVFKIPVVRGRAFTDRDDGGAPGVVIINQAMARQYWDKESPIGQRITIGGKAVGAEFVEPPREIVGVIGDVRDGALNRDPGPAMYVPYAQVPDALNALNVSLTPLTWLARTRSEPHGVAAPIQKELRQASGGLSVAQVRSMDQIVSQSTARSDFNMYLLAVFAGCALLLAAIGVYGLMAYSVQQRTQEIGIRRALGAGSAEVRNMVVFQGMRLSLVGVVLGVAAAFAMSQVLASLLFGVTTRDPVVFLSVPLILTVVALAAVWLPARRASLVDPLVALRYE